MEISAVEFLAVDISLEQVLINSKVALKEVFIEISFEKVFILETTLGGGLLGLKMGASIAPNVAPAELAAKTFLPISQPRPGSRVSSSESSNARGWG